MQNRFTVKRLCKPFCVCFSRKIVRQCARGQEKDIFKDTDFFREFDERFTYKKPISAMVQMLAKGLKSKNGNILASAAGYNAGLSRTEDSGPYKPYGKIPAISETASYLSHVLVNHYEITKRLAKSFY